jgi:imidazolonepropionase-like amidohydrolase
VRSIEHGTLIDEQTAEFVAEKGAYVVPTLSVIFALMQDGAQMGMPEVSRQKLLKVHEYALKGLEIMKRARVKMGFGTDLLGEQHPRRGTEFTIRREVLTPADILRSATSVNAEILQMAGKLGVVKPGAFADLLVVDGDPLRDIGLLAEGGRHLTHIMVDGRFVKHPNN